MLVEGNYAEVETSEEAFWARLLKVEWLGQTFASLCWIASVFVYGLSAPGDWLQLLAASGWFVANLAAVIPQDKESAS